MTTRGEHGGRKRQPIRHTARAASLASTRPPRKAVQPAKPVSNVRAPWHSSFTYHSHSPSMILPPVSSQTSLSAGTSPMPIAWFAASAMSANATRP